MLRITIPKHDAVIRFEKRVVDRVLVRVRAAVGHGAMEDNAPRWFGPAGMGPTGPSARTQAPYFFFFFAAFFFAIVSPPSRSARVVRC